MNLRFIEPWWFLAAAAAVPLAALGLAWFRAMSGPRRWVSVLLRVLVCLLVCAALAGATLVREVDRLAVIAVVDVSGSVQNLFSPGVDARGRPVPLWDRVRAALDAGSGGRRIDDLSAVIAFDRTGAVISTPQRRGPAGGFGDLDASPAGMGGMGGGAADGTDIAAAFRLAGAVAPSDAALRIALFSDGVQTGGDALAAVRELARAGGPNAAGRLSTVPIDVFPFDYQVRSEVSLESVESPSVAPGEATVPVRVTLLSTGPAEGWLEMTREGEAVDLNGDEPGGRRRVSVGAGRTTLSIPVRLPAGRVHRFEVVFTPDAGSDTLPGNNRAPAVTLTPGRSSVLLVDGVGGGDPNSPGAVLARTLRAGGVEVESVPSSAVVPDLLWLQRYDLVVLQNVAADTLAAGAADALATYVTAFGGGLVMVGGPDSFGAGGWKGTPVEPILPVSLDLPERLVSPAAAVVLIIDRSGSMRFRVLGSGRSQQEIASDGAAAAIESMDKSDLVGVITFDDDAHTLVPLGRNRDPKGSASRVRGIQPEGGTNLPPALTEAHRQLRTADAAIKHVIVLSDGRSQNTEQLPEIVAKMRADGIRVSTIAVGDDADTPAMAAMATAGEGTFYLVTDPSMLPRIFIKAVRVVRTPQIREVPFTPRLRSTGSPITDGLSDPPILRGLVLTQPRPNRGVINAMTTPAGEPLLSHWSAGVGRVAAFTSDAHEWAAGWLDWPGYARLWTQTVRVIARPQPDRGQELAVEIDGDRLNVRVNAADAAGRALDGLDITGWVHGPGGVRQPVALAQTGPGEYAGSVPAAAGGSYIVTLTPRAAGAGGGRTMSPLVGGASRNTGVEYRRLESDPGLMREIAAASGGRVLELPPLASAGADTADPVNLFDRTGLRPAIARTPLWRGLLIAIIAVYLLDVGSRRIAWDRLISREFGASLRRSAAESVRGRGAEAARTVGRLREVERTTDGVPGPAKLSSDDARALIEAEAARRKQARAEARKAANEAAKAPRPSQQTSQDGAAPAEAASPPSLLEAKRRARRRMDEDDTDGPEA